MNSIYLRGDDEAPEKTPEEILQEKQAQLDAKLEQINNQMVALKLKSETDSADKIVKIMPFLVVGLGLVLIFKD